MGHVADDLCVGKVFVWGGFTEQPCKLGLAPKERLQRVGHLVGGRVAFIAVFAGSALNHIVQFPRKTFGQRRQQLAWWAALVGLTFGYHLWSTLHELRHNWSSEIFTAADGSAMHTDIGRRGFVYSTIYIVTVTLGLHGLLLGIFLHGYPGAVAWARLAWPPTQALGERILAMGAQSLLALRAL